MVKVAAVRVCELKVWATLVMAVMAVAVTVVKKVLASIAVVEAMAARSRARD